MNTLRKIRDVYLRCLQRLIRPLVRRWDWWVYCRAFHSLRRMSKDDPGMSYLMELHMREYNARNQIPETLKHSTELFYESRKSHMPNAQGQERLAETTKEE